MFETWGPRLGVTEDESDHACREGLKALRLFDDEMERAASSCSRSSRRSTRSACCCSGGRITSIPGSITASPTSIQALGYPILTMRSIPKDPKWLARFFKDDLDRGFITTPLSVQDVWPENYSTNSVQKVWAAKFAARHPNVVVLDLSSFKCGHDAPTYGLIDSIINSSGTPASALHDIDANKPGGSIKIRVKTYAHTLKRFEEELLDDGGAAERTPAPRRRQAARAALTWRAQLRETALGRPPGQARTRRARGGLRLLPGRGHSAAGGRRRHGPGRVSTSRRRHQRSRPWCSIAASHWRSSHERNRAGLRRDRA